jgi:D-alanyl-lipoteichoic acid acyltransferase DltB (MBOAT superfamily)
MIADYCGLLVDRYYGAPGLYDGTAGLLATYLFGIQIYCDFSAYSDIAKGSARCFGVDLMQNFDQPLLSPSMAAFWRRWHISLGNWIRDYLYRPLGGNRVGGIRALFNVFVVAALSGLWHGAAWHFVAWGVYHGVLMVLIVLVQRTRMWKWFASELGPIQNFAGWFLQFHLSNIGFVMFRAGTFPEMLLILRDIARAVSAGLPLSPGHELMQALGFAFVLLFLGLSAMDRKYQLLRKIDASAALATCFYGTLAALMLLFGNAAETPFIYFQF